MKCTQVHYDFLEIHMAAKTHTHAHTQSNSFATLKPTARTYSQGSKTETKSKRSLMSGKASPPTQVASNYK